MHREYATAILLSLARHAQKALANDVHEVHIAGMTLSDWMTANGFSDERLAAELGVVRSTASRIRRGKVIPSRKSIERIIEITGGLVQPNSFFPPRAISPPPDIKPEGCMA